MEIKVLGIQTTITGSKDRNLDSAIRLIDRAVRSYPEVDFVCLPELFYAVPSPENAEQVAEPIPNRMTQEFGKKAREIGAYIIAGSFLEKRDGERYNTSLLFDRKGEILGSYSKIHLFDALEFKESMISKPGNHVSLFDTDVGRIAITICYDLRFPELYRKLAMSGADVIFVPSAFLSPRLDHWRILVQAAALQNLTYVVAVNLIGRHEHFEFFGRSMIVDPWGVPISGASDKECAIHGRLDLE